jgi:DNA-directed RNA polymerase specialized sigma24 family protein
VEVLQAEIAAIRQRQRGRTREQSFAGPVQAIGKTCAALQAEIRKTGDEADRAVDKLPPERQVALILRLISDLSPEYRVAVQLHCEELGGRIL